MEQGKGARDQTSSESQEREGEILKLKVVRHIPARHRPLAKNAHNQPMFRVGDLIRVMPPDRYRLEGYEAKILELSEHTCRYELTETRERFVVSTIILVPTPEIKK